MNTGSIIRDESWESVRQRSPPQFTSRLRLNVAENLAATLDLDLAVADRPRDPAGRLDQEPVADDQITFEAAAYLGLVDRCRALAINADFAMPLFVPYRRSWCRST